jgi:hypothetical protein
LFRVAKGFVLVVSLVVVVVVSTLVHSKLSASLPQLSTGFTWTGCCSDLTASAAEIEPTLDRWTAGSPCNEPSLEFHFLLSGSGGL